MPVKLPRKIFDQIEDVRLSGKINMLDRRGVQSIANERNHYALVIWLEDNPKLYGKGFFEGFEPEDDEEHDEQEKETEEDNILDADVDGPYVDDRIDSHDYS